MVEYDSHMNIWYFWDEANMKHGFWNSKEDADAAFHVYCRDVLEIEMDENNG